ncbi:MAG: ltrA [Paenibacillaceae bacterium]|nr:ltrA [Paenibacillaceae bacterium]
MDVHCHHILPVHLGGSDKYSNLRILHKDVHKLIHATQNQTIERLMINLGLTAKMVDTVKLEPIPSLSMSNLELIDDLILLEQLLSKVKTMKGGALERLTELLMNTIISNVRENLLNLNF